MYPIELNEIYKSYRILIAQDAEYLRCYNMRKALYKIHTVG